MANTISTVKALTTVAAKLGAEMLKDEMHFVSAIDKEDPAVFGEKFKSVQPGDTIKVNVPARFTVRTDATFSAQDVVEESVSLALDQRSGVDIALTSLELATDLARKEWAKRVMAPAISRIAHDVEKRVLQTASQAAYHLVGTPGTAPNSLQVYLQALQKMDEQLCPMNDRAVLINPAANTATIDALKGLVNPASGIGGQNEKGRIKTLAGFDFMRNNLIYNHTTGTQAGFASALSNGATQSGATIAIDGMTGSATLTKGTVVTFAGVYDVHPITKATYPHLKQFVLTADVTLSGGAGNLSISPTLVTSGSKQNASTTVADNSAITFVSGTAASTTYAQNLAFHPSALRFCSLPLPEYGQGIVEASTAMVDGIAIRALAYYDGDNDKLKLRLDTQFGIAVVRPEWMARISG